MSFWPFDCLKSRPKTNGFAHMYTRKYSFRILVVREIHSTWEENWRKNPQCISSNLVEKDLEKLILDSYSSSMSVQTAGAV